MSQLAGITLPRASRPTYLAEVSEGTGFSPSQLRGYAIDGTIPGAQQASKGKRWVFDRELSEAWWQKFNAVKSGEVKRVTTTVHSKRPANIVTCDMLFFLECQAKLDGV